MSGNSFYKPEVYLPESKRCKRDRKSYRESQAKAGVPRTVLRGEIIAVVLLMAIIKRYLDHTKHGE